MGDVALVSRGFYRMDDGGVLKSNFGGLENEVYLISQSDQMTTDE